MHSFAIVVIPPTGDVDELVESILAQYKEEWDEETEELTGFWDWYQIGGRWTGVLDDSYDPEKDPRNKEGYFGNREVKWPTQWVRFDGDVVTLKEYLAIFETSPISRPFSVVTDCHVIHGEDYKTEDYYENADFNATDLKMKKYLESLPEDLRVVIVDYHS